MTDQLKPRDLILPRGLRRPAAAAYIGVGTTTFDQMINDGLMPLPKRYRGCLIWDRCALDEAFMSLPENEDKKPKSNNPWNALSNV